MGDLIRSAGVLPIAEEALHAIIDDLESSRDEDLPDFVEDTRYSLRAIGAILPADHFDVHSIGQVAGIEAGPIFDELVEILLAQGPYEGETSVNTLRQLIGLVDDGVRPDIAARHLGVDDDELEILADHLWLQEHWTRRILDKAEIVIAEGGGPSELAQELGLTSKRDARRLHRWALKELRRQGRKPAP